MELRHLRYFLAVADELNFGRAARRLKMSQPPLSRQIRRLEGELGILLFERDRRKVSLTFAGRVYRKEARRILQEVESSAAFIREKHGHSRRLGVGYVPSANLRVLPRILKTFCRLHSDIELSLHPLTTDEQLLALRDGHIDVGLLRLPAAAGGVSVERLVEEASVVALPERHPLSRLARVSRDALGQVPVFHLDRPGPRRNGNGVARGAVNGVCPKLTLATGDVHDHLGLIAAGIGASFLPESVLDVRRKGVVYRRCRPPAPSVRFGLAYRRGERSPEHAAFLEVARRLYAAATG